MKIIVTNTELQATEEGKLIGFKTDLEDWDNKELGQYIKFLNKKLKKDIEE